MNLTDSIHTYLTTAPTSLFVQQEVTMVAAWEGRDNLLWRVKAGEQDAAIKLYLDAGQARSRRQFDGQQTFAPLGIAPRPLWYDRYPQGLARQVLVYEWVEGREMGRWGDGEMGRLGEVIAQVHSSDGADVRRFCPHPLNLGIFWRVASSAINPLAGWLEQRGTLKLHGLFQQIADVCDSLVETSLPLWQQSPPTPVHGDLRLENALATPFGTVVLLDWEMFGLGDPALEIANFLQRGEIAEVETWLDRYLSRVDQPDLAQRIAVYRRLLPFQSLCYLLNGLRSLASQKLDDERRQSLPFLYETLAATIQQAARSNGIEEMIENQEIARLGDFQ